MDTSSFIIGVASSLCAGFIGYLFRNQIVNITNILFFQVYPVVKGKYSLEVTSDYAKDPKSIERNILTLKQFGSKISGFIETFEGDKIICIDKVTGKVTPSRMLLFDFESVTEQHHNYGSGLFKISSDGSTMKGFLTFVCSNCQNAGSSDALITRVE